MVIFVLGFLGMVIYMYLTWKKLKEDYVDSEVIIYLWLAVLGFMLGGRMVFGILNWKMWNNWWEWLLFWEKPGINYLGAYFGWLWVTFWVAKTYDWKIWRLLEDTTKTFLVLVTFCLLGDFLRVWGDRQIVIYLLLVLGLFFWSAWVERRYRSFGWYKSGKKGFVWISVNFWLWLALAVIEKQLAYVFPSLLSGVGLVILGGR